MQALFQGVFKGVDFVNTQGQFSSGKSEGGVHKVEENVNELSESENERRTKQVSRRHTGRSGPDDRADLPIPEPAPCGQLGRPRTIDAEMFEQLCMLLTVGFSRRQAATYLGFSHTAIANIAARHPELKEELERSELMSELQPEVTLMAAARKNWRAAAWYLTFKAKHPRPLSKEEKEEAHQEALAEERRSAERTSAWMRNLRELNASDSELPEALKTKVEIVRQAPKPRKK